MFENYGRGDLVQYLESKGYYVEKSDTLECLRVAADLDAQARAFAESPLVRHAANNAQRIMREALHGTPEADKLRSTLYGDDEDVCEDDENIFLGW